MNSRITGSNAQRGAFISLEGIEGAGKSTCVPSIEQWVATQAAEVVKTREPGGTPLAEVIRNIVLGIGVDASVEAPTSDTETLLMFASRAQHLDEVVRPALARGAWVICDRFTDATLAYQGAARELGMERIYALAEWVHGSLWPDLTLLFDVSVETGLARASQRGAKDRIEQERQEFFRRARDGYLELAQRFPDRVRVIDAEQSMEDVAAQVMDELNAFAGRRESICQK
ncbi:MAG: dTMP kinase [Gammaproteobacteria bacterium]